MLCEQGLSVELITPESVNGSHIWRPAGGKERKPRDSALELPVKKTRRQSRVLSSLIYGSDKSFCI